MMAVDVRMLPYIIQDAWRSRHGPERNPLVIALEEHYYDAELAATFDGPEGRAPETRRRC